MLNFHTEILPLMQLRTSKERHLFALYLGDGNYLRAKVERIFNIFI